MVAVGKGLFQCFCQHRSVKVELIGQIINIVVILHAAGELHQIQDRVQLFRNGSLQGVCIDHRSIKAFQLGRDLPLFLFWDDDIADTEVNTKGSLGVFDPGHHRCAYTGIFLGDGDRRNALDVEGHKIIFGWNSNDLLQHRFDLLRSIGNLAKQKVHINSHTTVKIRDRIHKQAALQHKVLGIPGFFQAAQEFFLAKELQAQLMTSPACRCFILQSCQYGCCHISH